MDLEDFRTIVETTGFDVWAFINAAIEVAASDDINELKKRRDSIVQKLYTVQLKRCRNCDLGRNSPNEDAKVVKVVVDDDDDNDDGNGGVDPFGGLFDDEPKKILEIKAMLESSELGEDALVEMLQSLADMDITFQALKETDIGRNVNKLRKHPSNEVRRLVKQLVRKWKDIVDEWVSMNQPGEVGSSALMGKTDGDSPQQKLPQNGHHQVPDFGYSPNPQNGSSGSDRNNFEPDRKPKPVPRKETPVRHKQQSPAPASTPSVQRQREQKDNTIDSDRLASARKRLQENYKEAENAKKQRTIQVMDIHEIPKSRNGFAKKGGGSMGRHW